MLFRRLAKDSAVYGGADFLTKLLSFFAFPIIAAVLSPTAFGVLELIFTVSGFLGLIVNCGLNNAVQRFYWDKDTTAEQRPMVVTSGLAALFFFSLFAVLAGLIFVPFVLPWFTVYFGYYSITFCTLEIFYSCPCNPCCDNCVRTNCCRHIGAGH
jgi:O-antigen/teichoic acid export membrane protein